MDRNHNMMVIWHDGGSNLLQLKLSAIATSAALPWAAAPGSAGAALREGAEAWWSDHHGPAKGLGKASAAREAEPRHMPRTCGTR